jgi:REP element-mobilizing transposase RayT
VWSTYRRLDLINEKIEKDLKRLIEDKILEKESELLCIGCTSDHIHLLVRLHPTISVSQLVGEVKGFSSYVLANRIYPESGFRWQGGFGAMTVSRSELSRLTKYIENQKEHHKKNNLNQHWELN